METKQTPEKPIKDPSYEVTPVEAELEDKVGLSEDVEPIFGTEGDLPGIPKEMTEEWMQKYGVLFRIWFLNEQYVYRNFTYYEYKELRKKLLPQYKDDLETGDEAFKEEIQKICVVWPQDYAQRLQTGSPKPLPAGIPFLLGDYILAASGFADSIIPDVISNENRQ